MFHPDHRCKPIDVVDKFNMMPHSILLFNKNEDVLPKHFYKELESISFNTMNIIHEYSVYTRVDRFDIHCLLTIDKIDYNNIVDEVLSYLRMHEDHFELIKQFIDIVARYAFARNNSSNANIGAITHIATVTTKIDLVLTALECIYVKDFYALFAKIIHYTPLVVTDNYIVVTIDIYNLIHNQDIMQIIEDVPFDKMLTFISYETGMQMYDLYNWNQFLQKKGNLHECASKEL